MQNYKNVCGSKNCVWFEIKSTEGESFLKWAKNLGCVWLNGEQIQPQNGVEFLHFSIHSDGKLANVPMFVWFANHPKFANVEKYVFSEYIKGVKVSPKSHVITS